MAAVSKPEDLPVLFGIEGAVKLVPVSKGHINRTFIAESPAGRYVLQALSSAVFSSPAAVMDNISVICNTFEKSRPPEIRIPRYLCADGKNYINELGNIWRMYEYTESSGEPEELYTTGLSFGAYIRTLSVDDPELKPVIEGFHDLEYYIKRFDEAASSGSELRNLIIRLKARLDENFENVPVRCIHGDAKADNLIPGTPPTVIDLDTAMHHYAAIDYGDMIRSSASKDNIKSDIVRLTEGFIHGMGDMLTERERKSLYSGLLWVTGELALRYLTDVYSERRYFSGKSREQCWRRSAELTEQLRLFMSKEDEIKI